MKGFILDAKHLSLVEKAESGVAEAQLELVNYYADGINGVPKDLNWAKYYCYQLALQYPKKIVIFWNESKKMEYARLFTYLGDLSFISGNYFEALKWYKKAKKHCRTKYTENGYREEMKRQKIAEGIDSAKRAIKGKLIFDIKKIYHSFLCR